MYLESVSIFIYLVSWATLAKNHASELLDERANQIFSNLKISRGNLNYFLDDWADDVYLIHLGFTSFFSFFFHHHFCTPNLRCISCKFIQPFSNYNFSSFFFHLLTHVYMMWIETKFFFSRSSLLIPLSIIPYSKHTMQPLLFVRWKNWPWLDTNFQIKAVQIRRATKMIIRFPILLISLYQRTRVLPQPPWFLITLIPW